MCLTVEFRCDERDARLFGCFGESLVLNFSITDLNGRVETTCRQFLSYCDGVFADVALQ